MEARYKLIKSSQRNEPIYWTSLILLDGLDLDKIMRPRKIKILLLFFLLALFCFGQGRNDVFSLVENASTRKLEQDIPKAYRAILSGRNICSIYGEMSDITNKLESDEVVLDFFELPKSSRGSNYLAFVLKRGMSSPRLYNICSDNALNSLLDDSSNFYNDTKVLTTILSPLEDELKDITTIYFVPTGKLHEIALEYCKDTNGKMFCENYEVYRLISSAALVNRKQHREYRNFSIWGGIELEADLPYDDADADLEPYRNMLPYLEDSYYAAESITKELEGKGKNVSFLHNETATEANFKALSGKNIDAFLIETHGIFTKECSITPKSGTNAPLDNHALALYGAAFTMDSGIVPQGNEDGLITEDEISKLALSHIDFAVISACKSGLGDIKWDGVHGLMRGFKQAGVNSLVMTLDDIVDYVSGQLWIQFFRNLTNGQSKREALLGGIKYIRTMDDGAFSHPKFWAPFILIDGIE